jgi:hypothetical protein
MKSRGRRERERHFITVGEEASLNQKVARLSPLVLLVSMKVKTL